MLIVALCIAATLMSLVTFPIVAQTGNAEVTRTKNLQYFELELGNADVTRAKNLQSPELVPNSADVTRLRNLQYFELEQNDADVTRLRNLQYFELTDFGPVSYITSLTITDQNGNPRNNFNRGDIAQFDFTIENIGSFNLTKALISTIVLDSSSTPIFLSYTFEDLLVGQDTRIIVGYKIPLEASIGTYTVKVMIFTDWPSKGGVGLDIEALSFFVS